MRVKMIHSKLGSPDGFSTKLYDRGAVYEVPQELGETFVREGVAKETDEAEAPAAPAAEAPAEAPEAPAEEKAVDGAPKNKAKR